MPTKQKPSDRRNEILNRVDKVNYHVWLHSYRSNWVLSNTSRQLTIADPLGSARPASERLLF